MGRVKGDLSSQEVNDTLKTYEDTLTSLEKTRRGYRDRNAQIRIALGQALLPNQARELRRELHNNLEKMEDLIDDEGKVNRERADFLLSVITVTPPDVTKKARITTLVASVDLLIRGQLIADALFDAATELANIAKGLKG